MRKGIERPSRLWAVLLVADLALIAVYYVLPGSAPQDVIFALLNAAGAVVAFRAARAPGLPRAPWTWVGAGLTLGTLADLGTGGYPLITGHAVTYLSPLDVLWLSAYPCYFMALLIFARRARRHDHGGNVLDSLIILVAGGTLIWTYVLSPALHSRDLALLPHVVAAMFPIMDFVLFAMVVRLLVGSRRNVSMRLLAAACVAQIVGDLLLAAEFSTSTFHPGGSTDALWMLGFGLLAAAAVHPSARSLADSAPVTRRRIATGWLAFLVAALLVGPIMLAAHPGHTPVVVTSTVTTVLLVMARMALLNHRLAAAGTAVERKSDELRHQALHDALTDLPNRTLITDRVERLLARNRRAGTVGAALFVDLDEFKNVNDTLGHEAGDRLLQGVAERLKDALRDADTIGRMGGDEFVVLVDGGGHERVARRILSVMRRPFDVGRPGLPVAVTATIGIAVGDQHSVGELLREADVALYQAKAAGKDCYAVFHADMETAARRRFELQSDVRDALARDQFRLVYQPIYTLDDVTLVGAEALLRWQHPMRGRIGAEEFVPLLESSGQIAEVGAWVLHEACAQMATWRGRGCDLIVSVNVSASQLDGDRVVDDVRDALDRSGLEPAGLTLDIAEAALLDVTESRARRVRELKALGVQIAIDDFGAGYSSLSYLHYLPVDCLKLDRAFTLAATHSPEADAFVHALVQLGKDLGLTTLAEGLEDDGQAGRMRGERVDEAQGFLFAKPLDAAAFEARILGRGHRGATRFPAIPA